jgi:hypothetical protein
LALTTWLGVAYLLVLEVEIIFALGLLKDSLFEDASLCFGEAVIIFFDHDQMFCLWVDLHLGGSVLRLEYPLGEDVSWSFDLDDAELVGTNSDDTLEALC